MPKIYNFIVFLFFIALFNFNSYSKEIIFKGNEKLKLEDLQTLSKLDIYSKKFDELLINELIRDLFLSDLITDISYKLEENKYIIQIKESPIINRVFINGNLTIDDDIFINNFINKKESIYINKNIQTDIKLIKSLYFTKGYQFVEINVVTEKINNNKINLIFNVTENKPSNIFKISFFGNSFFSDRFISSKILSKKKSTLNIFKSGSNLNEDIFNFDNKLIEGLYIDYGFFDVKTNYEIIPFSKYNYQLNFFIEEGSRVQIDSIDTTLLSDSILSLLEKELIKFNKKLEKTDFFYDTNIINDFISVSNDYLYNSNIYDLSIEAEVNFINNKSILKIFSKTQSPIIINKIQISGNAITKDKTIRSKIDFEPGDIINDDILIDLENRLNNLNYLNSVEISSLDTGNNSNDILLEIDENKKTGSINLAGSISGDTGLGFGLNINDKNIRGSGNELDFSINLNSEQTFFDILYRTTSLKNPKIDYEYSIYNSDLDLTSSFGYKSKEYGLKYNLKFEYNKNISLNTGFSYKNSEGYSSTKNINAISDNIGKFNDFELNALVSYDTKNDYLFPTDGISYSIRAFYSPKELSDNSYYKIIFRNDNYYQISDKKNYLFLINNIGFAGSENEKLKTINAFSLGGLNFKGFDYRGIGNFQDNIYLGGNKLMTSTIGYGGDFIFDESDNINYKLFYSAGSIWDSDYINKDNFDLRSSVGISLDILTPLAPISLTYAIPIEKNSSDKIRRFNFILGTSF